MKKIMFVIGGLVGGGAERVVTTVASFLAETNDFEVFILTYYRENNEYEYSDKIKRINISNGGKEDYFKMSSFKRLKKLRKNIKLIKPDDIICFLPHALVFSYISLLFTKYRKKITYAERANPKVENSKICKLKNLFVKRIKGIITQNNGQKKYYIDKTKKPVFIIPNPMYKELFNSNKKYSLVPSKIVSVGRLDKQKNYELAILSFFEIQKKYNNLEYYIYGKGPKEKELKELTVNLGIDKKIHFMGFEMNRDVIYSDKDIYLMTSKFEGMPNTLAEAMCYGVPVISTNCDFGPSDLICNENMGVLLDDYDIGTVVESIDKMISNYDNCIINATNAKKIVYDKYCYEKIMHVWYMYLK